MAAARSSSQVAVLRSTSIGGSVTAEASPRVGAFFLELVPDEPARDVVQFLDAEPFPDVVQLLDVVWFLDAARFLDVVRLLDVEQFLDVALLAVVAQLLDGALLAVVAQLLDAAHSPCAVHSPVETQWVDEAPAGALPELRLVFLGAVQV